MADAKNPTDDRSRRHDPLRERQEQFDPAVLDRSVIAVPLLREIERVRKEDGEEALAKHEFDIVVDLNLRYPKGMKAAHQRVMRLLNQALDAQRETSGRDPDDTAGDVVDLEKTHLTPQYLFASLTVGEIFDLVENDQAARREHIERRCRSASTATEKEREPPTAIFRVWYDFPIHARLEESCATIKADAARISFSAHGENIVWAVIDSGIDGTHPHFTRHKNLKLGHLGLEHKDFTGGDSPETDEFGHGTHVAGILAGELCEDDESCWAAERERGHSGDELVVARRIDSIAGVAPRCKLLSLKVLDDEGKGGKSSDLIVALAYVQQCNQYGRDLRVHGVNLSLGYPFDPEWFACGQSPLCVEVDRLVASGVVVVAAAGNHGYGWVSSAPDAKRSQTVSAGLDMTIQDPGNAARAITVGSTHRDMPHVYGVSYFSSKGPTGDGRLKPDLVAPGERILSCASGKPRQTMSASASRDGAEIKVDYRQESGTSMAAPHVSGAIAAFLSIRREFVGRPDRVKEIFLQTATDLGRERYFQGHGLVDLMRAIQSI